MTQNELIKLSEAAEQLCATGTTIGKIASYELDTNQEAGSTLYEVFNQLHEATKKLCDFNHKYAKEKFNVVA